MDKEIKEKWVTALESGEYQQCKGQLQKYGSYCCLGVLLDVYDPNGWHYNQYEWGVSSTDGIIPNELRDILGITAESQEELIEMNDQGKTFAEIAQYIRRFL